MTEPLDPADQALRDKVAGVARKGRPPGGEGSLNRTIKYVCDRCGRNAGRDHIFARQVAFINMVTKRKERTRIIDWICDECILKHPDYVRVKHFESPGMKDVTNAKG